MMIKKEESKIAWIGLIILLLIVILFFILSRLNSDILVKKLLCLSDKLSNINNLNNYLSSFLIIALIALIFLYRIVFFKIYKFYLCPHCKKMFQVRKKLEICPNCHIPLQGATRKEVEKYQIIDQDKISQHLNKTYMIVFMIAIPVAICIFGLWRSFSLKFILWIMLFFISFIINYLLRKKGLPEEENNRVIENYINKFVFAKNFFLIFTIFSIILLIIMVILRIFYSTKFYSISFNDKDLYIGLFWMVISFIFYVFFKYYLVKKLGRLK